MNFSRAEVIVLDEDLDADSAYMGLPCSSLRGYLFKLEGWTYNLISGAFESSVNGFTYQQSAIFAKSKDQKNWIVSRKLDKLIEYKEDLSKKAD